MNITARAHSIKSEKGLTWSEAMRTAHVEAKLEVIDAKIAATPVTSEAAYKVYVSLLDEATALRKQLIVGYKKPQSKVEAPFIKSEVLKRACAIRKKTGASQSAALTRAWVETKIEVIETRQFCLSMKSRWNSSDYDTDRICSNELRELRAQLAA